MPKAKSKSKMKNSRSRNGGSMSLGVLRKLAVPAALFYTQKRVQSKCCGRRGSNRRGRRGSKRRGRRGTRRRR